MQQDAEKPTVLLLINDLIFETKIRSTAQTLGVTIHTIRSAGDMADAITATSPSLIIIDLNTGGDALRAVERAHCCNPRPAVLAYVSHVDATLAAQAGEAGADRVLPRSRFNQELPQILARLRPGPPKSPT